MPKWAPSTRPAPPDERAAELPWVLAVREGDPLAERPAVGAADLAAVRLIGLPGNSSSRAHLEAWFAESGVPPPAFDTSVADWDTAILLAELGLGYAVVPELPGWRHGRHPGVRLVPVPELPPLWAGWAVRRWAALSPLARAFADMVTAEAAA